MKKKVLMPSKLMRPLPKSGADLRQWRVDLNWSQTRAARELDVSPRFISRIENSADPAPIKRQLALACFALSFIQERN